jgi:hypothetical protein
VAATCSSGPDAEQLRLRAARALVEAHDHRGVEDLLAEIRSDDPVVNAEVELLRYELLVVAMDFPRAKAAWQRALHLVAGRGTDIETRLHVEGGRIAFLLDLDSRAVDAAEAAYALARRRRRHTLLARYALGSAQVYARDPRWRSTLEGAVAATRRAGAASTEYRATNNLVMGLILDGQLESAARVATAAEARARERRLGRWEQRMAVWLVGIDWHRGALARAVERGESLIDGVSESLDRLLAMKYVGHALADLGSLVAAHRLVEAALAEIGSDAQALPDARREVLGEALTIRASAEFWEARTAAALSTAEQALRLYAPASTSDTIDAAPVLAA